MALIVLTSATGSPGVTTSALGLAMSWHRPVILIDADPAGAAAVQAGYFRGADLGHDATLVDLLVSHRDGTLATDLPRMLMTIPDTGVQFLPGLLTHTQAASLAPVWGPLGFALRNLDVTGSDVIIDAGRLGLVGSPVPLIYGADLTLLVTRSTLPALRGAAPWAETLRESATNHSGVTTSLGVLLIAPGHPYSARDTARTLGMPVVATLTEDRIAANVLSLGATRPRRWDRSSLAKSYTAAASAIGTTLTRSVADLTIKEHSTP
jgi:hypothetical protein